MGSSPTGVIMKSKPCINVFSNHLYEEGRICKRCGTTKRVYKSSSKCNRARAGYGLDYYVQGYYAFGNGLKREANPHQGERREQWFLGWDEGKADTPRRWEIKHP